MNDDGCYDAECNAAQFSPKYKKPKIPDLKPPEFPKLQVKLNLLGCGYSFHGRSKVASKTLSYKEEVSTDPCSTSRANYINY